MIFIILFFPFLYIKANNYFKKKWNVEKEERDEPKT